MSVDAAAGGALMGKSIEAMKALLEDMASNNYHWSSEQATLKRTSGVYGVDVVDMLANKVDALVQRFDRLGTPLGSQVGALQVPCLRVGPSVRYVASKAMLLLGAIPFTKKLSMPMLCKTSTLAHKITPTQTHTTPVGEIILISPTETTTLFFPMPSTSASWFSTQDSI